jgi:formylglycine-generating enzyme required for sulfatase activity
MISITRRRAVLAVLALFLVGVGYVAWTLAEMPPLRYYLRYGLYPYCAPTGAIETYEGVEFVEIGPGIFRMGSDYLAERGDWIGRICAPLGLPWGEQPEEGASNEMPEHWVEFERGFWIARTEVTNEQYERFRPGNRRTEFTGEESDPVAVSLEEARLYCAWLGQIAGQPIRLPSESEWECACRGGSDREFSFGDDEAELARVAWFGRDLRGTSHRVATKEPNNWGLYDFHGNLWEWCEDTYHENYKGAPTDGSAWTDGGLRSLSGKPFPVIRGGFFGRGADHCRSAKREEAYAIYQRGGIGFRPAYSHRED